MANNTYQALLTQTLSTAAASVTFSSIPQGYTDLFVVCTATATVANSTFILRVGSGSVDSGTNYSTTTLYGNGTTATSTRTSNVSSIYIGDIATSAANTTNFSIMNYSNATTNKTVIGRNGISAFGTQAFVGLWRSTVAVNTISLALFSGNNFAIGSTFTIYAIKSE